MPESGQCEWHYEIQTADLSDTRGGMIAIIVNCDRQILSFRFYQNAKQVNSKIIVYRFV